VIFYVCLFLLVCDLRHGDLKAGNVLLTAASIASSAQQHRGSEDQGTATALAWMQAGCLPLTAKVADFGLATPLGHADTHATMMTRVSGDVI
jgi:serine/threonine protein kinase